MKAAHWQEKEWIQHFLLLVTYSGDCLFGGHNFIHVRVENDDGIFTCEPVVKSLGRSPLAVGH